VHVRDSRDVPQLPPEILGEAARKDLVALMPHLEGAPADIKRPRSLIEKELAQKRTFKAFLARKG
jgi:hypothetical protein